MTQGLLFIAWAGVFMLLAILALIRLAILRVESPLGRRGDGLPPGRPAPRWRMPDSTGAVRQVPVGTGLQVLLFADHAIVEFPTLADGFRRLRLEADDLEALMISRADPEATAAACAAVGLRLPIIAVDDRFYRRHNVWVVPHIMFLDRDGTVLVTGNVAEEAGLMNMWRHARLLAGAPADRAGGAR